MKIKAMFKHKKEILSNKLPLISIPLAFSKTATVLIMARTGSKYENRKESGLSHFLEHMFFKGSANYPNALALSAALDALGGEYNAFTSKEYTGYYVKVAAGKLVPAMRIISDMIARPLLDAEEIERERGVIIEELNMYEDNPLMHIEDVLESCLYGDTPAGWDTIGSKENIRSFARADFLRYFKKQYGANSLRVLISGAIGPSDLKEARILFSSISANAWKDKLKVKDRQSEPAVKIAYKQTDQINLALALRTFPIGDPDEMALKLMSAILGGSMSSRLFVSLRERSGLAYYIKTGAELYTDSGYMSSQAGVPRGKAGEAVRIIMEEYRRLAKEAVPKEELARTKDLLSGRLLMQLESSDEVAEWYGRQSVLRNDFLNPEKLESKLRAVSSADIMRLARRIMHDNRLNLAIIGPMKGTEEISLRNFLHF